MMWLWALSPQMCMYTCCSEPLFLSFFLFLVFFSTPLSGKLSMCARWGEVYVMSSSSTLYLIFETESLSESGAHWWAIYTEQGASRTLLSPLASWGLQMCPVMLSFLYPGAVDLNSGSYACSFFSIGTLFPPFFFFGGGVQDKFLCLTALVVL